jgi:hypothetical protein
MRIFTLPKSDFQRRRAFTLIELLVVIAGARLFEFDGGISDAAEKKFLPFAGRLITSEIGLRFLTDFLAGDVYFKVHREGHNLDRWRTQFKLAESIERQESAMNKLVQTI